MPKVPATEAGGPLKPESLRPRLCDSKVKRVGNWKVQLTLNEFGLDLSWVPGY